MPLACVDEDSDEGERGSERDLDKIAKEALPGTVKSLAPKGSPLLPNLGKANANAYWMDLTVSFLHIPRSSFPYILTGYLL